MSIDIVNTTELAKRLGGIDPKHIRKAIKLGQLEPGVHFMTIATGEPLFQWSAELVQKLHDSCRKKPAPRAQEPKTTTNRDKINFRSLGLADVDSSKPTKPKPTQPKPTA